MKVKDKTLISYLGKNIDESTFKARYNALTLDFRQGSIDLREVNEIIMNFTENINSLNIMTEDYETLKNVLDNLLTNHIKHLSISTKINDLEITKDYFSKLPELSSLLLVGDGGDTVLKKCETVPTINYIGISNFSDIKKIDTDGLDEKPKINLYKFNQKILRSLDKSIINQVDTITFDNTDRTCETINVQEIFEKLGDVREISAPPVLNEKNIPNLNYITDMVLRCGSVFILPEIAKEYKRFYDYNYGENSLGFVFSSAGVATKEYAENLKNSGIYFGSEVSKMEEFSVLKEENKSIVLAVNNMTDIPLEVAEKLRNDGVNCLVRMSSYDNCFQQNTDYNLDEYIEMSKKMEELIGDIDINLPEEEKFKQIYIRITSYLEYDYPAAYPRNKQEKKYSEANFKNCRNLLNALLEGKTVCAGYADVLKNACLLKGIECEYIQGPVDTLMSKENYRYSKKNRPNQEIVYMDDKDVIAREYHAWNKVKINGEWYNCDPTWDRDYIINGKTPKFALLSDEIYKNIGRPTSEVLRHPCKTDATSAEKSRIFDGLEPCEDLFTYNKLMEFESTVDEYGNPRQLPVIPKETILSKILDGLRRFSMESKAKFYVFVRNLKEKINPEINKTEELQESDMHNAPTETLEVINENDITEPLPTIDESEIPTEPLPIVDENDITEPLPIVDDVSTEKTDIKKPSWELSKEQLNKVKEAEKRQSNTREENIKDDEKEIGE